MSARRSNVISLFGRRTRAAEDWTQAELAQFYRVEAVLLQSGLSVEQARGVGDEGDPWFAFCHTDSGDVFVHLARIDGLYIVESPAMRESLTDRDFGNLITRLADAHPLLLLQKNGGNVTRLYMHPAALLISAVAVLFYKTAPGELTNENSVEAPQQRHSETVTRQGGGGSSSHFVLNDLQAIALLSSLVALPLVQKSSAYSTVKPIGALDTDTVHEFDASALFDGDGETTPAFDARFASDTELSGTPIKNVVAQSQVTETTIVENTIEIELGPWTASGDPHGEPPSRVPHGDDTFWPEASPANQVNAQARRADDSTPSPPREASSLAAAGSGAAAADKPERTGSSELKTPTGDAYAFLQVAAVDLRAFDFSHLSSKPASAFDGVLDKAVSSVTFLVEEIGGSLAEEGTAESAGHAKTERSVSQEAIDLISEFVLEAPRYEVFSQKEGFIFIDSAIVGLEPDAISQVQIEFADGTSIRLIGLVEHMDSELVIA